MPGQRGYGTPQSDYGRDQPVSTSTRLDLPTLVDLRVMAYLVRRPMKLSRILANAFARRVAAVVVALILAWLGINGARAQTYDYSQCMSALQSATCATVADATAALQKRRTDVCAQSGVTLCNPATVQVTKHNDFHYVTSIAFYYIRNGQGNNTSATRTVRIAACPAGQVYNPVYAGQGNGRCQAPCDGRAAETFSPLSGAMIPNGSVGCTGGCATMISSNGDGTYLRSFIGGGSPGFCDVLPNDCAQNGPGYVMNYGLGLCQPPVNECAANQIKDPLTGMCSNGCPAGQHADAMGVCVADREDCPPGNIRSPAGICMPGEGQCAAGEARRPNGTCGRDSDGDGEADEDDDDDTNDPDRESASGGDSCNAPPSCSGGAIACLQVKIQWRIDCNTRKDATVSGGSCSAMPVCTGKSCDALEYSQLLQQWRTACAIEKLKGGEGETGIKDHMTALKQAEVNSLRALGTNDGHGDVNPDDIWANFNADSFNPNLFGGGGGQCPATFTMGGKSWSFPQQFWTVAALINWLVVACAYLAVAWMLR